MVGPRGMHLERSDCISINDDTDNNLDDIYKLWIEDEDENDIIEIKGFQVNKEEESQEDKVKDALFTIATVYEKEINVLVNTGSKGCVISKHFLDKINKTIDGPGNVRMIDITGNRTIPLGKVFNVPVKFGNLEIQVDMLVTESKEYNVVLGNEYLDQAKANIDFKLGLMTVGNENNLEYIPITCWKKIEDPNILCEIPYKQTKENDLELELEEDEDLDDSRYFSTRIQTNQYFTKVDNQLISNIRIENSEDSRNNMDEIFKMIKPEIEDMVLEQKVAKQKPKEITITENKSTFIGNNLNEEQETKIKNFLKKNSDIFATQFSELRQTNVIYHAVHTENHFPIKQRAYRVSPNEQEHIKNEIEKMEKDGIICKSESF